MFQEQEELIRKALIKYWSGISFNVENNKNKKYYSTTPNI